MSNGFLLERWRAQRLTPEGFSENFKRHWEASDQLVFKYEACQYYSSPGDTSYAALQEGKFYKAARLISEQLIGRRAFYEDSHHRGIRLVRVRAVEFPLTYYLNYEFVSYLTSQSLGEEIRVAHLSALVQVEIGDFLLFDDRVALIHNYAEPDNEQNGGWIVDTPEGLAYLARCRKVLTESSVPLDDFVVPGVS